MSQWVSQKTSKMPKFRRQTKFCERAVRVAHPKNSIQSKGRFDHLREYSARNPLGTIQLPSLAKSRDVDQEFVSTRAKREVGLPKGRRQRYQEAQVVRRFWLGRIPCPTSSSADLAGCQGPNGVGRQSWFIGPDDSHSRGDLRMGCHFLISKFCLWKKNIATSIKNWKYILQTIKIIKILKN